MNSKKYDKISLTIYIVFILAIISTELALYNKSNVHKTDLASTVTGLVTVLWFYFNSQRIVNHNQFFKYGIIGLIVFIFCLIKQFLTGFHNSSLFVSGLPFIFIVYFRTLTYLFYKDFPNSTKKPVIVFASQYGTAYFDNKDIGYVPTMKEKLFSLLLFIGFIFLVFGLIILLKEFYFF